MLRGRGRVLASGLVTAVLAGTLASVPSPVAADSHHVNVPIEGFEEWVVVDGDLNLTIPAAIDDVAVGSQCTPIPDAGMGSLCIGNSNYADLPPLEVIGIEELTPLVKRGRAAESGLNWIVVEGLHALRALHDVPNDDRLLRFARPELRAYILTRILDIIDRYVYGVPLTADERRTLEFVENDLLDDDRALAEAAYSEFQHFRDDQCSYSAPSAPPAVTPPVTMPDDVVKWCRRAQNRYDTQFVFAPPQPTVEHFTQWGAYRIAEQSGLASLHKAPVKDNTRTIVVASTVLGGAVAATAAAVGTAALVGSSAALAAGATGLMAGSAATAQAMAAWGPAVVQTMMASTGAAAAAAVVGIVIMAAVVTAISIWMLVEHESVGTTLRQRVDDADVASDPLGLAPWRMLYEGLPLNSELDPENPPIYRSPGAISKLVNKVVEWTTLKENGDTVGDPDGVWPGSATTANDHRFVVERNGGPAKVATEITLPQVDGKSATVRFNRGWMVVDPSDGPTQGALSVGYVAANGEPRRLTRAPASVGGFSISDIDDDGSLNGKHTKSISFKDGQDLVTVRMRPRYLDLLEGPRPSVVGPRYAGRVAILRPNPVNVGGSTIPLDDAESLYDYRWVVTRLNPETGQWDPVVDRTEFGPRFVPTLPGSYDARVTMTSREEPSEQRFGSVRFEVTPPPMDPAVLSLQDDGLHRLEVDLQLTEPVQTDEVSVTVEWPPLVNGLGDRPRTEITQDCQQTDVLECTTPRTGLADLLVHTLDRESDLRVPIRVTVRNSTGGRAIYHLPIDNPQRPTHLPPPDGANDGRPGEVVTGADTTQVVMPLEEGARRSTYVAAVLSPGTGAGDDFGIVDPATGNTTGAIMIPGLSEGVLYVDEQPDGTWILAVQALLRAEDLGSYSIPVLVQQTSNDRNLVHVVLHVVHSAGDRYRALLRHEIDPDDVRVDAPPDLEPAILGGRVEWEAYSGEVCLSLQYAEFGAPPVVKCGPKADFFGDGGVPLAFPYAELFPGGMSTGRYRANAWLPQQRDEVDNTSVEVSFVLTEEVSYPPPRVTAGTPKVKGKPKVGKTLKARPGRWSPEEVSLTYKWLRDGRPVKGAKGKKYALTKRDQGHRISVRVRGELEGWRPRTATSQKTPRVRGAAARATPAAWRAPLA